MTRPYGHFMHEADIGSGEKQSAEQHEIEQEMQKVRNPKMDKDKATAEGESKSGRPDDSAGKER